MDQSVPMMRMKRWTFTFCVLSTCIYSLVLPYLVVAAGLSLADGSAANATPLGLGLTIFVTPISIPVFCSFAWHAFARDRFGKARLLCFGPALLLLLAYFSL